MIIGDSIVRHVRATLAEVKVHIHCFPGARVLDVSAQIPAILKDDESIAAVVIHVGVNDTKLRQTETLKRDFRSLIETDQVLILWTALGVGDMTKILYHDMTNFISR